MKKISQAERAQLRKVISEHLKTAERFLKSGDTDKAMEQVERAIELDPKNAYAHAYKERILEVQQEMAVKEGEVAREQRKLAEEAERKRQEADEGKVREEEKTRLRAEEEALKHRAEEEQRRKEKLQRLEKHLSQATMYLGEGKFEKALDETEKALQLDPNNPDTIQLDTKIHQEKLGREKGAADEARRILEDEKRRRREERERKRREAEETERLEGLKEIDRHLMAARDFLGREKYEKALEEVEKALQLNPRHEPSIELEGEIRKEKTEAKLRTAEEKLKRKEAEQKRRALLREVQEYLERAESFYDKGEFEKALDEIIHAFSLDPTHPVAKELAGKVQRAIDEKARAEEDAKRRDEEERRRREEEERRQVQLKRMRGYLQAAEEYLQKQKFDKASVELKRVYEVDPENAEANVLERRVQNAERLKRIEERLQTAEGYLQKKKFDQALREVKRVYELDLENAEAKVLVQRIRLAEDEVRRIAEEEERSRRREEEARREEEKARKIEAILQRSEEFYQNSKFQRALDEVAKLRLIDPDNARGRPLEEKARRALEAEEEVRRKGKEEAARAAESRKKMEGMLHEAERHFLDGEYDKSLRVISRIFVVDKGNAFAAELKESVEKAKEQEDRATAAGVQVAEKQKVKARRRISPRRRARIRQYILTGSILVLSIAAYVVFSFKETLFPESPSLVVLPLKNESGNRQEDYLFDGLTAALVSDFGVVPDLKTVGTATSLAYKDRGGSLAALGRELHVSYVLSGSARRSGDLVEVSVEVRDTVRGEKIWSKQYSEPLTNLHTIREDVFNSVMEILEINPPRVPRPFAHPWSSNPIAINLYLQAMSLFRQRTEQSLLYSIRLFNRALGQDPKFTSALAGKAYAHALLYEREWEHNPETLETASKLAKEVIASNATGVLAYRTLGSVYRQQRSYAAAIDQLEQALAINPHDAGTHGELALVYGMQGNVRRGINAATKAVEIDPKNFEAHLALALVQHLARNYKAAVSSYDQVVALRPDVIWELLGLYDGALINQLAHERAQNLYVRYLETFPDDYTVIYQLARSYQIAGKADASRPFLNKVISLARQELNQNSRSAKAHLYIGLAQTRLGRFKEGVDGATRAIGLAPDDYTILYKTAGLYSMQKNTEESLKWFRNAVQKRYSFKSIFDHDLFNLWNEAEFLQISRSQ